ncbi:MAG TPA: hypothetical protein VFR58_00870, partial [Flavisolibacter sp.]|nr:hypothetical protein [Flavisolibacter sp.]
MGSPKSAIHFDGGFLSYQYSYRSAIDTPFRESAIGQHLLTGSMNLTVAGSIPLTITYFERQSNSRYFRDYRDLRVEFNPGAFQQLRARRLSDYVNHLSSQLKDPLDKTSLDYSNKQLHMLENWLNEDSLVNRLVRSRMKVLNTDTSRQQHLSDSLYAEAVAFIAYYDTVQLKKERIRLYRDSLQQAVAVKEKRLHLLRKIVEGNLPEEAKQEALDKALADQGIETSKLRKLFNRLNSIQTLALGKVIPNHSELTLRNININGINFEYNKKLYLAFSAGAIDYRARDFFNSGRNRSPQFVYLGRIGYGAKQGSHIYLTAFKGSKQLLNTAANGNSLDIYGLSFEGQLAIGKHHRLLAELAQSAAPGLIASNGSQGKASFNLSDKGNKAYSVRLNSYFPRTKSRIEAFYRYRGLNFQSFSSYYNNASLNGWQFKADQYFWKRQLRLNLAFIRNDFENDYLPV